MNPSEKALELIKMFEACRLVSYQCSAGVWTIGWGHTAGVKQGDTITREQAEELFKADIATRSVGLASTLGSHKLSGDSFGAVLSLVFNIGIGAFKSSSVYRNLIAGHLQPAADSFLLWNKVSTPAGGLVPSAGLLRRRTAERALFLEGIK